MFYTESQLFLELRVFSLGLQTMYLVHVGGYMSGPLAPPLDQNVNLHREHLINLTIFVMPLNVLISLLLI